VDSKIDLLYVTHNRAAFTERTAELMRLNTNWAKVRRIYFYDDESSDGATAFTHNFRLPLLATTGINWQLGRYGGPVAIMADFLKRSHTSLFAKIDSDTALPYGWLDVCLDVMNSQPGLDLLGIEAFSKPVAYSAGEPVRSFRENPHIGGIGLMRGAAFYSRSLPRPRGDGRFGFTEWQHENASVSKGFLFPALPVALLDRVPLEPWRGLTAQYVAKGWARSWPAYPLETIADWGWIAEPLPDLKCNSCGDPKCPGGPTSGDEGAAFFKAHRHKFGW